MAEAKSVTVMISSLTLKCPIRAPGLSEMISHVTAGEGAGSYGTAAEFGWKIAAQEDGYYYLTRDDVPGVIRVPRENVANDVVTPV
jgi:hypothetical protein